MLKIPFFNRKNYILLKFYCAEKTVYDYAPVVKSSNIPHPFDPTVSILGQSFKTCYGYVQHLKHSITIPAWTDFAIKSQNGNAGIAFPNNSPCTGVFPVDTAFQPNNVHINKIESPWVFESSYDCSVVMTHHILNTSGMIIPSGVLRPRLCGPLNIFNYVPHSIGSYTVKFKTPLVAIYALSEKPLHVESYYDTDKFLRLRDPAIYPFSFRGSYLKMAKFLDAKTQKKGATEAAP